MKRIASLSLLFIVPIYGQTSGPATAKGNCNIAVSGSGNRINIETCSPQQADEFRTVLKTIASNQQLDTATILKKLDECLQTMANRHLTDAQKASLLAAVSPLPGHKISVTIPLGNAEAKSYGMEFVEIFRKARWVGVEGAGLNQAIWDKDPNGIEVTVNLADARAGKVPPDAIMLLNTLTGLGLTPKNIFANPGLPPGETEIRIGIKPATQH
jgi:hypothetical protein